MSKLYNTYLGLKKEDKDTLYLFKSGIFYIFLDDDAKLISDILQLKLTNFSPTILKCGFPANSIDKYMNLLKYTNYNIKIINSNENTQYTPNEFKNNLKSNDLIKKLSEINIDSLSISEVYSILENFQNEAKEILNI